MIDADGSTDPREIPAFVEALLAGPTSRRVRASWTGRRSTDITRHQACRNTA
jgi:hypothetical protein